MEDTYVIRTAAGEDLAMTRESVRDILDLVVPRGIDMLARYLEERAIAMWDFEAACRHFGLIHCVFDVRPDEVLAERRARRARRAPPTGRRLPHLMKERDRDFADAMIDVYERRVEAAASFLEGREARPPAGA